MPEPEHQTFEDPPQPPSSSVPSPQPAEGLGRIFPLKLFYRLFCLLCLPIGTAALMGYTLVMMNVGIVRWPPVLDEESIGALSAIVLFVIPLIGYFFLWAWRTRYRFTSQGLYIRGTWGKERLYRWEDYRCCDHDIAQGCFWLYPRRRKGTEPERLMLGAARDEDFLLELERHLPYVSNLTSEEIREELETDEERAARESLEAALPDQLRPALPATSTENASPARVIPAPENALLQEEQDAWWQSFRRLRFLCRAVSVFYWLAAIVIALTVWYSPLLFALLISVLPVTLLLLILGRGRVGLRSLPAYRVPGVGGMLWACGIALCCKAYENINLLDPLQVPMLAVPVGLLLAIPFVVAAWDLRTGRLRSQILRILFLVLLMTVGYGYGGGVSLNMLFDRSDPKPMPMQLEKKRISEGEHINSHYFSLSGGESNLPPQWYEVSAEIYAGGKPGDQVLLWLHPGALGLPWYVVGIYEKKASTSGR